MKRGSKPTLDSHDGMDLSEMGTHKVLLTDMLGLFFPPRFFFLFEDSNHRFAA